MNRVEAVADLVRQQLDRITPEKMAQFALDLELDLLEVYVLQNRQAIAHATGRLSTDEASSIYRTLRSWAKAPVENKIAVFMVMRELDAGR